MYYATHRSRFLTPLLIAAAVISSLACGETVTKNGNDGGGGVAGGGAGVGLTGGGGSGGGPVDPCVAEGTCCPPEYPNGSCSYDPEEICSYEIARRDCQALIPAEASCDDGRWSSPEPAACGPLGTTSCDPFGAWLVTYGPWEPGYFPGTGPSRFEVSSGPDGTPFISAGESVEISPTGCQITLTWVEYWEGEVGSETETTILELTISSDTAAGMLTYSCEGECGWYEEASASAVRDVS